MPWFDGAAEWLNSGPPGPAELPGHVVLVNFWTFTCINWLRQEPYVRAWSQAYRDEGLVVIGVHTPEFSFEHELDRVRLQVAERAIDYPVAVDNDGVIRDKHFGEGQYDKSERVIQQLLGVDRELVSAAGVGVEAEADWNHLRTPETYLGYARGERFGSPNGASGGARAYELPTLLRTNYWALAGEWTIEAEKVTVDQGGGSIAFHFDARDAHAVLSAGARGPIPFRVRLDGQPPGPSHGVDVDEDGNGVLKDGRLYQLVREPDTVRARTLEITFLEPGAEAYAFTFG
jgi:thiol-disulfide isomerase/thioredoxin